MICEYCGKEQDGTYGNGRFCSGVCVKKFASQITNQRRHQESLQSPYRTYDGKKLNVTRDFVEKYKQIHTVCEICGGKEVKLRRNQYYKGNKTQSLCVDHNHKTLKFRGVLCHNCNIRLGWLEKHRERALEYLDTRG